MALTSVDDVASMLRWGAAEKTKYAAQLAPYIAAASEVVENEAGPIELRTVQHLADGAERIVLPSAVSSVTSIEEAADGGYVIVDGYVTAAESLSTVNGWTVDKAIGVIYGPFTSGRQNIRVTYTAGYAEEDVPEAAKLAATMVAADMWAIASQRAPSLDDQLDPSYLMPKVVRNLLAGLKAKQMPGFA